MKTFKEVYEARSNKREEFEGVEADKIMRELEKDKNKRVQTDSDHEGYRMDSILTKSALYFVFYEYHEEGIMKIIKNPNNKDVTTWKESKKAS